MGNDPNGDIVIGTITDFGSRSLQMIFQDPDRFNAVQVRIRRTTAQNGEVPLFFANVFGISSAALRAKATAAVITSVQGFHIPKTSDPITIPLLPITLHETTWQDLISNTASQDVWTWDSETKSVIAGADGVTEANLYPEGNNRPGNFGTVNIGTSANDTNHLGDQIVNGISKADVRRSVIRHVYRAPGQRR